MATIDVSDTLLFNIGIDSFSLILIGIVYFGCIEFYSSSNSKRLFRKTQRVIMLLLISDMIMWLSNGFPGKAMRILGYTNNIVYFFLQIYIAIVWFHYCWYRLYKKNIQQKWRILFFYVPSAIFVILDLLSPFFGTMFYLDEQNFYHRGAFDIAGSALSILYILIASIIALKKWHDATLPSEKTEYLTIASFLIGPIIGGVIQAFLYGCSLIWPCTALSTVLVFVNLKKNEISVDALTGLNNRGRLDQYLRGICKDSIEERTTCVIIDINLFKRINDTYGHIAGDEALIRIADSLRITFGEKDAFIARYGGDEFTVILRILEEREVQKLIQEVKENVGRIEMDSAPGYKLSVSTGYAVFPTEGIKDSTSLLNAADKMMYEEKHAYHKKR